MTASTAISFGHVKRQNRPMFFVVAQITVVQLSVRWGCRGGGEGGGGHEEQLSRDPPPVFSAGLEAHYLPTDNAMLDERAHDDAFATSLLVVALKCKENNC